MTRTNRNLLSIFLLLVAVGLSGFFIGEHVEEEKLLKADNAAFQNSGAIENEVKKLSPYQQCLSLGRVPDQCKVLMRGLDKTSEGK